MDRSILAVQRHSRQTSRSDHAFHRALSPFHSGVLAATAGTLVAVGLLMLTMLVLGVRPAEAVEGGGAFNVTNNTTNDYTPSYSPSGEKIVYRGGASRSDGLPNDIYTINVNGTGRFNVTDDNTDERDPSYSPDGQKIAYKGVDTRYGKRDTEIYTITIGSARRVGQVTHNLGETGSLPTRPTARR